MSQEYDIIISKDFQDYTRYLTDGGIFLYFGNKPKTSTMNQIDVLYWNTMEEPKYTKSHILFSLIKPIYVFSKTDKPYYNKNIHEIQKANYLEYEKEYALFKKLLRLYCPNLHDSNKTEDPAVILNPDKNKKLRKACLKLKLECIEEKLKKSLF